MEKHTARFRNVVGPQVKKFRKARGWSQTMLATKCQVAGWNITRDIVAGLEGRFRWVGDFEIVILAKVLAVPASELFPDRILWSELESVLKGHA